MRALLPWLLALAAALWLAWATMPALLGCA